MADATEFLGGRDRYVNSFVAIYRGEIVSADPKLDAVRADLVRKNIRVTDIICRFIAEQGDVTVQLNPDYDPKAKPQREPEASEPKPLTNHDVEQRSASIARFIERQKKARQWIAISELAQRYARNRVEGLDDDLQKAMKSDTELEGYSTVFLSAVVGELTTPERPWFVWLRNESKGLKFPAADLDLLQGLEPWARKSYLDNFWIPAALAARWCEAQNIDFESAVEGAGRPSFNDAPAISFMREFILSHHCSAAAAACAAIAKYEVKGNSEEAKVTRLVRAYYRRHPE